MDDGPQPGPELIWMLGYSFDDELLSGLVRAVEGGYTEWVLIPAAVARPSTPAYPGWYFRQGGG